jgi:hypothetical protein
MYLNSTAPPLAASLYDDFVLFASSGIDLSTNDIIGYLPLGVVLGGSSTLHGSLQQGDPALLTTRGEIVRWFGILMLHILSLARVYTSSENDFGYGSLPLPTYGGGEHWVCSNTLYSTSAYTSIKLDALVVIVLLCVFTIILSFLVQPFLTIVSRTRNEQRRGPWKEAVQNALIALSMHDAIQLHRIAVEKTYNILFRKTTSYMPTALEPLSVAPKYGMKHLQLLSGSHVSEDVRSTVEEELDSNSPSSVGPEVEAPHNGVESSISGEVEEEIAVLPSTSSLRVPSPASAAPGASTINEGESSEQISSPLTLEEMEEFEETAGTSTVRIETQNDHNQIDAKESSRETLYATMLET